MATLTSQQLKDSYQSLVTIGDSIVSNPTSGQLENGLGNPITALGIGTNDPQSIIHVSAPKPTYTDKGVVFRGGTTNNNSHSGISLISAGDALAGFVGSNFFVDGSTNSQSNTNRSSGYIQFTNTTATGETSDIRFGGLAKGTTTITERMRIDSSGTIQVRNQTPTIQLYNTDTSLSNEQTLGDLDWYQNDPSGAGVNVVAKIRGVNESSFQGQGALAFHVGASGSASEKVRIDSLGNVGIGATSIATVGSRKTLHIDGSSGSAIRLSESSTDIAFLSYDSTSFFRLSSSDQIALMTAGSEAMRIDASGNVGINDTVSANFTNNYDTKLLVGGDIVARSKTSNESMVAIGGDATSAFIKAGKQDASLTARALRFEIGSSEAMRIDSDGLKFNGDTATDNALDDYEEGTWTPAWDFATSGSVAITVSSATYTKIGRMVSINARFFTTSISSPTGDATLTGLPFTAKSSVESVPVSIGQAYRWGNNINNFRAYINSSSYIQFADNNYDNTSTTSLVGADFDAGVGNKNVISISATYFV